MPRYMLAYVGRSPTVHNLVLRSYTMHELRNQNVVTSSPVRRKQLLCFGHREGSVKAKTGEQKIQQRTLSSFITILSTMFKQLNNIWAKSPRLFRRLPDKN